MPACVTVEQTSRSVQTRTWVSEIGRCRFVSALSNFPPTFQVPTFTRVDDDETVRSAGSTVPRVHAANRSSLLSSLIVRASEPGQLILPARFR